MDSGVRARVGDGVTKEPGKAGLVSVSAARQHGSFRPSPTTNAGRAPPPAPVAGALTAPGRGEQQQATIDAGALRRRVSSALHVSGRTQLAWGIARFFHPRVGRLPLVDAPSPLPPFLAYGGDTMSRPSGSQQNSRAGHPLAACSRLHTACISLDTFVACLPANSAAVAGGGVCAPCDPAPRRDHSRSLDGTLDPGAAAVTSRRALSGGAESHAKLAISCRAGCVGANHPSVPAGLTTRRYLPAYLIGERPFVGDPTSPAATHACE